MKPQNIAVILPIFFLAQSQPLCALGMEFDQGPNSSSVLEGARHRADGEETTIAASPVLTGANLSAAQGDPEALLQAVISRLKSIELSGAELAGKIGNANAAIGASPHDCRSSETNERDARACRRVRSAVSDVRGLLSRFDGGIRQAAVELRFLSGRLTPGQESLRRSAKELVDNAERVESSAREIARRTQQFGDQLGRIRGFRSEAQLFSRDVDRLPEAGESVSQAAGRVWSRLFEPAPEDPGEVEDDPSFPVENLNARLKAINEGIEVFPGAIRDVHAAMNDIGRGCDRASREVPEQVPLCLRLDQAYDNLYSAVEKVDENARSLFEDVWDAIPKVSIADAHLRPTAYKLLVASDEIALAGGEYADTIEAKVGDRLAKIVPGYTSKGNLLERRAEGAGQSVRSLNDVARRLAMKLRAG